MNWLWEIKCRVFHRNEWTGEYEFTVHNYYPIYYIEALTAKQASEILVDKIDKLKEDEIIEIKQIGTVTK